MISRWDGADARLRELTKSHQTLRIVLTREGHEGNLIIACLEPETIQSPIAWSNAKIRIDTTHMSNGEIGVLVFDRTAIVEVKTGTFEVAENVKLK